MSVSQELLDQYDSSKRFLTHRFLCERDEVKRRKLGVEFAQCVAEEVRARLRRYRQHPEAGQ